ncbi:MULTISPECIES: glycosyltransferase family 4 protein [Rahnella]|uniref:glycosyltransferase family 4 protein n=1 Tax=Rahnella TaxID=34037 RepID=UPI003D2D337D
MRILLIGNQSGTIILFRKRLIQKLVLRGWEVYTLTMDSDLKNNEIIQGFGAIPLTYKFSRSGMNPISDVLNTFKLSSKIRKLNPDVVFSFFPKPVIFGSFAAKMAGVQNIFVLLEGLGYCFTETTQSMSFKKRLLKSLQVFLYKLALPLANKVMFLNKDDYHDLLIENDIKVKSYEVVGGIGVNLNDYNFCPVNTINIHFSMISRLLIEKGIREFVAAATIVKKMHPDIKFSVAGAFDDNPGGIPLAEYEEWIKEGAVEFLGQISDIKSYIITSSVFVLPSYREGVPRSTQEAMAIGRAIITTDVPGCRDTVVNGVNGFMVPPFNVEELVVSMLRFIEDPSLITSMGNASRTMAESMFDEEIICDRLINIME